MNALIVIDTLDFGGSERQVVMDANALVRCGCNVTVAFFKSGPLEQELDPGVGRTHIQENSVLGRVKTLRGLYSRLEPDLVMAHMLRAEIAAGFAAAAGNTPVLFNEHGLGVLRGARHRWALRLASKFACEVWCASDACRRLRIEKDRLKPDKVRTVYNFFDLKREGLAHGKLKAQILSELGGPLDAPIIGFVGRFDPVKRLELLVSAAMHEALRKAIFVLVGDGIQGGALKEAVAGKGLGGRFHFPGFVANPGDYFDVFDVFVLPSKRESLSVALLEAGSAGLPAVAFDVGGNSEIIENGVTGYVVPDDDCDAFRKALVRLVQSDPLRFKMGAAAKERVSRLFSKEYRMEEILESAKRHARKGSRI